MTRIRSTLTQESVRAPFASVVAAVAALFATSCGPNVKPPDVTLNPAPRQRYEIALTVKNAPGALSTVTGSVQFDIKNEDCVPIADPIVGVRKHTAFQRAITFKRVGDDKYVGYVYADQLLDDNYYDLGVCRWSLTWTQVTFHAGTAERVVYIDADEIVVEKEVQSLCRRRGSVKAICLTPLDKRLYEKQKFDFTAILESRKVTQ